MLDEVDLVDVAACDRLAYGLDRAGVLGRGPGALPGAEPKLIRAAVPAAVTDTVTISVVIIDNIARRPDGAGEERQRAGLGWGRRAVASDRRREAIPEVEIGGETGPFRGEEAAVAQPRLQTLERAGGLVQLERLDAGHAATPDAARAAPGGQSRA